MLNEENIGKKGPVRIIIAGGGTGGHIFPAIAIANAIKKMVPQTEFLFVGAMEFHPGPDKWWAFKSRRKRRCAGPRLARPFP